MVRFVLSREEELPVDGAVIKNKTRPEREGEEGVDFTVVFL
jgi:hypothetical protein